MEFIFILLIASSLLVRASEDSNTISSIFEGFGYSPVCVASALASCELSSQKGFNKSVTSAIPSFLLSSQIDFNKHINASLGVIISSLQEIEHNSKLPKHDSPIINPESHTDFYESITSALFNVTDSLAQISASLQEIKPKKRLPRNCQEILESGDCESGVRTIYPKCSPVKAYCDQSTDGGGWTVFQKRDALPIREDFFRTWDEYVAGFGNVTGEFWLGLENIFDLTRSVRMEMRIDLEDYEGGKGWAKYGKFSVGGSSSKYALDISRGYLGGTGDDMSNLNGMKFSTHDQDNDAYDKNCAEEFRGAWWYNNCHTSNLNGYQHVGKHASFADGINWKQFRGYYYSLKHTTMKLRPIAKI